MYPRSRAPRSLAQYLHHNNNQLEMCIHGIFRKHLEHSGNIQGTFRAHSGNGQKMEEIEFLPYEIK
jgi:hypothetical protein